MPASTRLRYKVIYDFEDVTVIIASPLYDSILDFVIVDELVIDFESIEEAIYPVTPSTHPMASINLLNDRIKDFLIMWGIYGGNLDLMEMKLPDNVNMIRVGDNT